MIIFYSKSCESCAGNHALANMKNHCRRQGVDFQEHTTNSGAVLEGYSLTPLDTLQRLIKEDKDAEESIG